MKFTPLDISKDSDSPNTSIKCILHNDISKKLSITVANDKVAASAYAPFFIFIRSIATATVALKTNINVIGVHQYTLCSADLFTATAVHTAKLISSPIISRTFAAKAAFKIPQAFFIVASLIIII